MKSNWLSRLREASMRIQCHKYPMTYCHKSNSDFHRSLKLDHLNRVWISVMILRVYCIMIISTSYLLLSLCPSLAASSHFALEFGSLCCCIYPTLNSSSISKSCRSCCALYPRLGSICNVSDLKVTSHTVTKNSDFHRKTLNSRTVKSRLINKSTENKTKYTDTHYTLRVLQWG